MEISRRGLLRWAGIAGTGLVLPGCAKEAVLKPREEGLPALNKEDFTQSVCALCPAGCGVTVRRVDGRAVGVTGLADHPVNQGGLCPKGPALLQELYHPDRLSSPVARGGARGSGAWSEITWDEAFHRIGRSLHRNARLDAVSVSRDWEADQEVLEALTRSFGGSVHSLPEEMPADAYLGMHGTADVHCDPAGAKLLVSFGWDWLQAHPRPVLAQQLWARLRLPQARAHVVQVEGRFSVTAGKADSWVPARPGTEGYVALGVAREMIASGRYDQAYVRSRAAGFGAFARAVEPFTVPRVAELTGAPENELKLLIAKFEGTRPAVAVGGRGSAWSQAAIHALNALTGSLGEGFFTTAAEARRGAGELDLSRPLADVVVFDRVNPVFLSPLAWKPALEKARLVVTVSPFMTETAEYSDLVLPCRTPLERLQVSRHRLLGGKAVVNGASRAVDPVRDSKEPGDIFQGIAEAAHVSGAASGGFAEYARRRARELGAALVEGKARWAQSAGGRPPPATSLEAAAKGVPGLEGREDKEFPLFLCIHTPLAFSCGEGAHLPYLQSIAGVELAEMWETWAEVHPDTARACGLKDGRQGFVVSKLGRIRVRTRVESLAMPGVVSVPFGLGHASYGRWAKGVGSNPMEIAESPLGARVRMEAA